MPPIVLVVCFLCYFVAVSRGEVKPFPYCTITQTATDYPQNILFRFILSPSGILMQLLWQTAYYVLTSYANQVSNGEVQVSPWIIWMASIGQIFFQLAINTIDGGKMDDSLHTTSAVIFFLLFWFDMILVTFTYYRLRKYNPEIISQSSLWTKIIICILSIALFVEIATYIINPNKSNTSAELGIIEWGAMIFLCAYFYSFCFDWENFFFALDIPSTLKENSSIVNVIPIFGQKNSQSSNVQPSQP